MIIIDIRNIVEPGYAGLFDERLLILYFSSPIRLQMSINR